MKRVRLVMSERIRSEDERGIPAAGCGSCDDRLREASSGGEKRWRKGFE